MLFDLSAGEVRAEVVNAARPSVRVVARRRGEPGPSVVTLNGRNSDGFQVSEGLYLISLVGRDESVAESRVVGRAYLGRHH